MSQAAVLARTVGECREGQIPRPLGRCKLDTPLLAAGSLIMQDEVLYYVDYECNDYMEEWNFENWGIKYWSKTPEFLKYVEEHS